MGREPVAPDWPALTEREVRAVLACYEQPGGRAPSGEAVIAWQSPRPMSAAALVDRRGSLVFLKRHHVRVRTPAELAVEHAFVRHLRSRGQPVPALLRTSRGETALRVGDWVYEAHRRAAGYDLYRDALSWTPYTSLGHARSAGAALARFHQAARGFPLPARPAAVLTNGSAVIVAADPLAEIGLLLERRPGLAAYLATCPWEADLARHHIPAIGRLAPRLRELDSQWGHGDWHPSNLTWSSAAPTAEVATVVDFGLANRTYAVHDLAIAIERIAIGWLDLAATGEAQADLDAVDALLEGYEAVRPLSPVEGEVLSMLLPVVHLEYALSEIEYFADVVQSQANADLAYETYLLGHTRWFERADGATLLDHLARRANR